MTDKILKAVEEFQMLPHGCSVVVGVSGGSDSMALLSFLLSVKNERALNIVVAHVNHGLRGADSDEDEEFVRGFCLANNLDVFVLKADIKKTARESGCGLEECGRNVRYRFFSELADKFGAKIATAHTLSDNVETVIFNLTRGAGLNGLCGIAPVRGRIVRPMIYLTKGEIERYCEEAAVPYRVDASNFQAIYTRNKIRLQVLPLLKEINPAIESAVCRLTEQLSLDERYMEKRCEESLEKARVNGGFSCEFLKNLDISIKTRAIKRIVQEACAVNLQKVHVDLILAILKSGTGAVNIPGDFFVSAENGTLKIRKNAGAPALWESKFCAGEILTEPGRTFIIEIIPRQEYMQRLSFSEKLCRNSLDYDKINDNTVLRNRREGDVFKLNKRNVSKTLKKLFNECKVPLSQRDKIAVLESGAEILWVEGFGASQSAAVSDKTKNVVIIFPKEYTDDK